MIKTSSPLQTFADDYTEVIQMITELAGNDKLIIPIKQLRSQT